MLSPEPMRHLSLVVPTRDLEVTTRAIAQVGVLHLLDVRHAVEGLAGIRPYDVTERLAQLDGLTRALGGIMRFLGVEPAAPQEIGPGDGGLDLLAAQARTEAIAGEVEGLRKRCAQLTVDSEQLSALLANLRALAPVGLPLEDLRRLHYVHLTSGLLIERNLPRLRDSLARIVHLVSSAGPVGVDGRVLVTALCLRPDQDVLDRALRSVHFERVDLPAHLSGTPEQATAQVEAQLASARHTIAASEQERTALAQRLAPEIRALHAAVERERLLAKARGLMGHSERIALITGWVPAMLAPRLEQSIRAANDGRCVIEWTEPPAIEDVRRGRIPVPILLHNALLIRPFERLLRGYGLPRYGEVEPTAVVALGFLTMFGFMFGDVGQGAILFGVGYFIYRRMFRYRDYAVMLMECGVFAVAFGFLYGSVFGVEHWLPALWLRPMEDIPRLMQTAILFGIGFLSIGLGLNLLNAYRRRDLSALWERNGLLAAMAYWIAAALFIRRLTVGVEAVTLGTALIWLGIPLGLIFLKEPALAAWKGIRDRSLPGASDVFALIVQSLVEVLDTVLGTVANTATFIRLAAFALSHAGLFLATFSVADAVFHAGGGTVGALLVVALGNAVIIGLEGLIVAIQSIRLEYYEFFSKFYSGGGEEYRPLRFASAPSART
ncbi:MAG TPA: V-type ATPase 116kDa subunit family protein [Candidatus Acidoferrales bacterium]|nr:V-type ATPase 116kDa subunit family protein [Candidatus Acidoferrales bacterium]